MNCSTARPPCPSPSPGVHSNSHPLSRWCHPAISFSVIPFSSCRQSLPAYLVIKWWLILFNNILHVKCYLIFICIYFCSCLYFLKKIYVGQISMTKFIKYFLSTYIIWSLNLSNFSNHCRKTVNRIYKKKKKRTILDVIICVSWKSENTH